MKRGQLFPDFPIESQIQLQTLVRTGGGFPYMSLGIDICATQEQ